MLCFICNLSTQRKRIQILNKQHVDIQDKIFIIKVIFVNSSVRDVWQKISRFNSSWRIFDSCEYLFLCLLTILFEESWLFSGTCWLTCWISSSKFSTLFSYIGWLCSLRSVGERSSILNVFSISLFKFSLKLSIQKWIAMIKIYAFKIRIVINNRKYYWLSLCSFCTKGSKMGVAFVSIKITRLLFPIVHASSKFSRSKLIDVSSVKHCFSLEFEIWK